MRFFVRYLLLIFVAGLIVACKPVTPTLMQTASPLYTVTPTTAAATETPSTSEYPPPFETGDQPGTEVYPGPIGEGTVPPEVFNPYPLPGEAVVIPTSGYEPAPGDQKLKRGEVFIEMEDSDILSMESYPIQVSLMLNGNLPTGCHQLRVVVTPANSENRIMVEAYSVVDPNQICAQMLEPFEARIPLGSYTTGKYSVYVNGELLGEFGS